MSDTDQALVLPVLFVHDMTIFTLDGAVSLQLVIGHLTLVVDLLSEKSHFVEKLASADDELEQTVKKSKPIDSTTKKFYL